MKERIKVAIIVSIVMMAISCNSQKQIHSSWKEEGDEILPAEYVFDNKENVYYHIANDKHALYIDLRIPGEEEQQKILRFGFTTWIECKEFKQKLGVGYPLKEDFLTKKKESIPQDGFPEMGSRPERRPSFKDKRASLLSTKKEMELFGFDGYDIRLIPVSDKNEIKIGLQLTDSGELNYRLVIPLHKLALPSGAEFDLIFESGDMQSQRNAGWSGGMPREGINGAPGQFPPRGMGGNGPEGMPGERAGRSMQTHDFGQSQEMMKPIKLKVKHIQLSSFD